MNEYIKLYTELQNPDDIITISEGISELYSLNNIKCKEPAYLPIENWRKLTSNELNSILASEEDKLNYQTIGLIKLSEEFITEFKIDQIRQLLLKNNYMGNVSNQFPNEIKALENYSKNYQIISEKQKVIGISCSNTSDEAVTFDYDSKCFIGLHIDSWFNEKVSERFQSKNRICYNLGFEDRYLIFSNIPVVSMLHRSTTEKLSARETIRHFLRKTPELKCFKLRIRPFEGYIFPTENLIHEGKNKNNHTIDITFTTISYFQTFINKKTI